MHPPVGMHPPADPAGWNERDHGSMWIVALFLAVVAALAWIVWPLFGLKRSWTPEERATVEAQLLEERGRLLRALKDLEHEFEAGSIGEDEYQELRGDYLAETAAVYRRLEELGVCAEESGGDRSPPVGARGEGGTA